MTSEADDDIILPDPFQNTHKIHMNQSGIFRIGVLKRIGKMKTCFFAEFSSFIAFEHHETPLDPSDVKTPYFSILMIWVYENMAIWVSKYSQ
jgi:hypothetical protein